MKISPSRAVIFLAGALALSSVANAQDPVGVWNTKMDFNGNVREATVTIARGAGGALTGTWSSEQGDSELSNIVFEAGTLSFIRKLSFNAQSIELAFEGKIDGDNLTGSFRTDFGEIGITGTRVGGETKAGGVAALVGTWNGTSAVVGGEVSWRLVIKEDLTAVVETEDGGMLVRDLALRGDRLTYVLAVESQGQKYELAFVGTLEGSTFSGRYSLPSLGEIAEVTAAKAEAADLTVMVGTWQLTAEAEAGQQESSLVINEDMSGTINFGEFGSFPLDYVDIVDGDELWFGIAASIQGQQVYIEFSGKLDGEKFTGGLWVGDREVARLTGTKKN